MDVMDIAAYFSLKVDESTESLSLVLWASCCQYLIYFTVGFCSFHHTFKVVVKHKIFHVLRQVSSSFHVALLVVNNTEHRQNYGENNLADRNYIEKSIIYSE